MSKNVVLITGISSGMGYAAAKLFHNRGWIVYGGARRVEKLKELQKLGINVQKLDVTDELSNADMVNRILKEQGRIDVLINNAGYGEYGSLEEVPIASAKQQFDVNLFGLANITQLVLPTMRKQRSGRIINNSSIGGRLYMPMGGWYHASKHALEVYSDVLRMETREFGIKVSVIEPGGTKTEWGDVAAKNAIKSTPKNSPYSAYVDMVSNFGNSNFPMATPEKLAQIMWRAATDSKPKHRYLPGISEKSMTFLARKLPVTWFDSLIFRMMKQFQK